MLNRPNYESSRMIVSLRHLAHCEMKTQCSAELVSVKRTSALKLGPLHDKQAKEAVLMEQKILLIRSCETCGDF